MVHVTGRFRNFIAAHRHSGTGWSAVSQSSPGRDQPCPSLLGAGLGLVVGGLVLLLVLAALVLGRLGHGDLGGGAATRCGHGGGGGTGLRLDGEHLGDDLVGGLLLRVHGLLDVGGIEVHVLLAGEGHEGVHDLVGDGAQHEAVVLQALVAGEVQRLADDDAHTVAGGGDGLADRLGQVGADHRHGHHGGSGGQGDAGHAGLAAVEAPVGAARALGVDAEELPRAQAVDAGLERRLGGLAAGTVHGDGAHGLHEVLHRPALDALAGEVVGLADEGDLAVHQQRQEEGVDDRQVVGGQDRRALGGNVLLAADPGLVEHLQGRADCCLDGSVSHAGPPVNCWLGGHHTVLHHRRRTAPEPAGAARVWGDSRVLPTLLAPTSRLPARMHVTAIL